MISHSKSIKIYSPSLPILRPFIPELEWIHEFANVSGNSENSGMSRKSGKFAKLKIKCLRYGWKRKNWVTLNLTFFLFKIMAFKVSQSSHPQSTVKYTKVQGIQRIHVEGEQNPKVHGLVALTISFLFLWKWKKIINCNIYAFLCTSQFCQK